MDSIHLKQALQMLNSGKPVTLRVLTAKGELRVYEECVGLAHPPKQPWRNVRLLRSGQIRRIRDILIIGIDDLEVFI